MRSVQTWKIVSELCTDLIVLKVSLVLSFVGKTPRLIFVGIYLRVTRIYMYTALAESKYFFASIILVAMFAQAKPSLVREGGPRKWWMSS